MDVENVKKIAKDLLIGEEFDDILICNVCSNVMKDPQEVFPCRHMFCRSCVCEPDQGHNKKTDMYRCPMREKSTNEGKLIITRCGKAISHVGRGSSFFREISQHLSF